MSLEICGDHFRSKADPIASASRVPSLATPTTCGRCCSTPTLASRTRTLISISRACTCGVWYVVLALLTRC